LKRTATRNDTHQRRRRVRDTNSAAATHQPETPMKLIANIAGVLLGLIFNVVALNFFFHFFEMPVPPAD